jgi:hypothetical protein
MDSPWTVLTTRYGDDVETPSVEDLDAALDEVYEEANDEEHPNAWLRYGRAGGPLYVLDVYAGGRVVLSQWADADCERALAPDSHMESVPRDEAAELWRRLTEGDVEWVRSQAWRPGS